MARIRTIKPEFPQSESMGRISRESRLLFILLWTIADDSGRLRGNSRMLASLLYPYDDDAIKKLPTWLKELSDEECIQCYENERDHYIAILNWSKHQKIDKPSASKIATPPEIRGTFANIREDSRVSREGSRVSREGSSGDQGSRTEGSGNGPSLSPSPSAPGMESDFDEFWGLYPRRPNDPKSEAKKKYLKARERATKQEIHDGASAYRECESRRTGDERKFIAMASTWLHNSRWDAANEPEDDDYDDGRNVKTAAQMRAEWEERNGW